MINNVEKDDPTYTRSTREFLTIAGILVLIFILGFMVIESWYTPNSITSIYPSAGSSLTSDRVPPAQPTVPAQ